MMQQSSLLNRNLEPPTRAVVDIGPYDPMLPGPMRLRLDLAASGGAGGPRIVGAEVGLGYNYVGLEAHLRRKGVAWERAPLLVERLCAGCSQANLLAYAQAVEDMAGVVVPPRAAYLRLVLAETERVTSHLLNIAATVGLLGMPNREANLRDLRERIVHTVGEWQGARVQPGIIIPGGVGRDMDEEASRRVVLAVRAVERAVRSHTRAIIAGRDVAARLAGLGKIEAQEAAFAGLRGPVLRATGVAHDIRVSFPTGAYEDEAVTVVVQRTGDAYARLVVRLLECLESFRIIEQALDELPPGPIKARGNLEARLGGEGIGRVEGPRGELFCWVRGSVEKLEGLHLSAGSAPTLGILPALLKGNLDDLPLLLLSLDLCPACAER